MASSPWGYIQDVEVFERGIASISTASHGGTRISKGYALSHLSAAARARGELAGGYYWYEEDCAWAIPAWELPHLQGKFFEYSSEKNPRVYLFETLSSWKADYLIEIGVNPDPIMATFFYANKETFRLRREKSPRLITSARSLDAETTRVWTADGVEHIVKASSYDRGPFLNLLSHCETA